MATTSPVIRELARQLMTGGTSPPESRNRDLDEAVLACEKFRIPLTKLVGAAAFSMLLARAVALAIRKDPSLTPLRVTHDGTLAGIEEVRKGLNGSHLVHEGGAIVLAELLGLLITFIGGSLTLVLIREAWPDASLELTVTDSTNGLT